MDGDDHGRLLSGPDLRARRSAGDLDGRRNGVAHGDIHRYRVEDLTFGVGHRALDRDRRSGDRVERDEEAEGLRAVLDGRGNHARRRIDRLAGLRLEAHLRHADIVGGGQGHVDLLAVDRIEARRRHDDDGGRRHVEGDRDLRRERRTATARGVGRDRADLDQVARFAERRRGLEIEHERGRQRRGEDVVQEEVDERDVEGADGRGDAGGGVLDHRSVSGGHELRDRRRRPVRGREEVIEARGLRVRRQVHCRGRLDAIADARGQRQVRGEDDDRVAEQEVEPAGDRSAWTRQRERRRSEFRRIDRLVEGDADRREDARPGRRCRGAGAQRHRRNGVGSGEAGHEVGAHRRDPPGPEAP